ncbi:hypothetical protein ACWDYJ_18475 [Streptomyces sp. NPDC003042]
MPPWILVGELAAIPAMLPLGFADTILLITVVVAALSVAGVSPHSAWPAISSRRDP